MANRFAKLFCWEITKDYLPDPPGGRGDVGVRNFKVQESEEPPRMPQQFRLLDDDGEVYYEGVCSSLSAVDGDTAFGPLDWAASHAGCTQMQYLENGTWLPL